MSTPTHLPRLESLRILGACVRHANFTRAADELGLTPAAVSLRIRDLEIDLGTKLFQRSGPRLIPTNAAHRLAGDVSHAMQILDAAVAACRMRDDALRVTAVPSFAARWLLPRLPRYHQQPDSLPVRLDTSMELLAAPAFDVAIRTGLGGWEGFDVTPLMPVEATPMLSPTLAAGVRLCAPADLAQLPLLSHDDWPRWFAECGAAAPRLQFCAGDYPTHELDAMAAIDGIGVALLSPTLYGSYVASGQLVRPFEPVVVGPQWHYVLTRSGDTPEGVLSFKSWLEREVGSRGAPGVAG